MKQPRNWNIGGVGQFEWMLLELVAHLLGASARTTNTAPSQSNVDATSCRAKFQDTLRRVAILGGRGSHLGDACLVHLHRELMFRDLPKTDALLQGFCARGGTLGQW
eukprot:CAMPEP_0206623648 /NCGR_PEP_ID=MMETSP0325_2-20121206/63599_1 /ASSEMBLY_ACC=CAM_ASM_000347 /TAXON_ID=2866 /ORGANISM="Crypthecodinium cohnii, Strain Seligo" /LENGTH=106 /DNA_ID=CAMNT_0054147349 /DNA_START=15 /DNA_END=335 /DNA_ORIENTATION=+